jgi:mediator of RNA polymerase II transcription subunit 17
MLQALLLGMHAAEKSKRATTTGSARPQPTATVPRRSELLQPIIDLLQYQQFCARIKAELDKMASALKRAGVPCTLRFDPVGEAGQSLQNRLTTDSALRKVGGEALLRLDDRLFLFLCFFDVLA